MPIEGLLTVAQAAERLGVNRQRVHQLLNQRKLTGTRVGAIWLVDQAGVEERVRRRAIDPEQQIANIEASVAALRARPRHRGRQRAIHAAERQLAEARAAHQRGELAPIADDGLPF